MPSHATLEGAVATMVPFSRTFKVVAICATEYVFPQPGGPCKKLQLLRIALESPPFCKYKNYSPKISMHIFTQKYSKMFQLKLKNNNYIVPREI